ncbi:hypothetical protein HanIR_Chr16g0841661 [Helianthus annuus]|nr:hypothetical protein HanIR_Chr16g0841661 [Helianthus annuus]
MKVTYSFFKRSVSGSPGSKLMICFAIRLKVNCEKRTYDHTRVSISMNKNLLVFNTIFIRYLTLTKYFKFVKQKC